MENYVILYREIRRERYSLLEYLKNEKKIEFLRNVMHRQASSYVMKCVIYDLILRTARYL